MSADVEIIPPSAQPGIVVQWTPGGGSSFLTPPTHLDETDAYFFLGWDQLRLIRRQNRSTGRVQQASGASDFATAWTNRATLEYT